MSDLYDDLLTSTAQDGASAGVLLERHGSEVDDLLVAWMDERHQCIENRMFLERARRLLGRILAEGELTPTTDRKARRLMRELKATGGVNRDD